VCEFEFGSAGVGQHVCRHMRENRSGPGDLRAVLDQVGVPKMVGHRFVPEVCFGYQEVGSIGDVDQRVRPGRVAGVGDGSAADARRAARGTGRPQYRGRPAWTVTEPMTLGGSAGSSSMTCTPNRRRTVEEPGNITSIASVSRAASPCGPATVSGAVRRRNWPSSMSWGIPPKWSTCICDTNTVAIVLASIPCRASAMRLVAPQSSRTPVLARQTDGYRPATGRRCRSRRLVQRM
jgi:hypothetical protein